MKCATSVDYRKLASRPFGPETARFDLRAVSLFVSAALPNRREKPYLTVFAKFPNRWRGWSRVHAPRHGPPPSDHARERPWRHRGFPASGFPPWGAPRVDAGCKSDRGTRAPASPQGI